MTSRRTERVADRIREIVSGLLQREVRDPRVGFATVTDVSLSPDLKIARVYVSILKAEPESALKALGRATPFIRRALAQRAGLRFTPELRFELDRSIETGMRVDDLLEEALGSRRGGDDPQSPVEDPAAREESS